MTICTNNQNAQQSSKYKVRNRLYVAGIIFGLALVLRLVFLAVWHQADMSGELLGDRQSYVKIGQNVFEGKGFQYLGKPSLRRPPVYPLVVGAVLKLTGSLTALQLLQAVIGAVSCVMLFLIGCKWFGSKVGLLAAGIMSVDYLSIRYVAEPLPETFFICALLLCFYQLSCLEAPFKNALALKAGVLAGITLLTKDSLIYFFPSLAFGFLLLTQKISKTIVLTLIFGGAILLVVAPWIARNMMHTNRIVMITARSGACLYLGNNPSTQMPVGGDDWSPHVVDNAPDVPAGNLVDYDRYYMRKALAFIKENPNRFIELMGQKFKRLWTPVITDEPVGHLGKVIKFLKYVTYVLIMALALPGMFLGLWRFNRLFPMYALVAYTTLIHSITISGIRYRLPIMPFLMLFAASTVVILMQRGGARKNSLQGETIA